MCVFGEKGGRGTKIIPVNIMKIYQIPHEQSTYI